MGAKLSGLVSLDIALLKWQNDRPCQGKFSIPSWGGNGDLDRDVLAALLLLPFPGLPTALASSSTSFALPPTPPPPENTPATAGGARARLRRFRVEMEEPVACHRRLADFVRDGPFEFFIVPRSEIAWVVEKYCEAITAPTGSSSSGRRRVEESFTSVEIWARNVATQYMSEYPYFSSYLA